MNEVGIGEHVVEEAGAGPVAGPAARLGGYVNVLDFEEVARLCALDVHRAGERGPDLGVQTCQICLSHGGLNLGVGGVAGFEDNFLARIDLDDGRDVGMPAVVSELGLLFEALGAVDGDGLHGFPPVQVTMCQGIMSGGGSIK